MNAAWRTGSRGALRRPKRKRTWLRLGGTSVSMAGENQYTRDPAGNKIQQRLKVSKPAGPGTEPADEHGTIV